MEIQGVTGAPNFHEEMLEFLGSAVPNEFRSSLRWGPLIDCESEYELKNHFLDLFRDKPARA